jgi:hypothetical protein
MGKGTYLFILFTLFTWGAKSAVSAPFCFSDVITNETGEIAVGVDCATGNPITLNCTSGTIVENPDCDCATGAGTVAAVPKQCCVSNKDTATSMSELKQELKGIQSTIQLMNRQCVE